MNRYKLHEPRPEWIQRIALGQDWIVAKDYSRFMFKGKIMKILGNKKHNDMVFWNIGDIFYSIYLSEEEIRSICKIKS